jgi:hypothetical protein
MGMFSYGNFKSAGKPDTPQFAAAAARQGQLDSDAQMQANALRSQNMLGAGELYNVGMGENTPIADKLGSMFGGPEVGTEAAADAGSMLLDLGGEGTALSALEGGATEAAMTGAAETAVADAMATEALTAGVGGAVAPAGAAAAEAAAGTAAAGGLGSSALAALGPIGIALALGGLFK